ncbi:MAG: hypothetical protein CTY20_04750 [Hyphomicrobium sp.]|nr:MAG: hypothetical protein CTY20_04750 [Hyphomicrobium sp.]
MSEPQLSKSEGVTRLKELLFDNENQTLIELARRIDALSEAGIADRKRLYDELKGLSDQERRDRLQILERIDGLHERLGTPDRLESSVAGVIDGAIRRAEVDRHEQLASAMSPLVVRTVKTEIRNSRDDLVEALYPMTGRMVRAYVASAIKDLMAQINRKLEQNPFMLRLASLTTGRSVAELALADSQRTSVEELYLIQRDTGALIAHWPESAPDANRDQMVSGVLTALTEFASEAFSDDGRALRQIDLGASQVYLRLSPLNLLAVRCTGSAHAAVEQAIDNEFLSGLERLSQLDKAYPPGTRPGALNSELLNGLSQNLKTRIAETEAQFAAPRAGTALLKSLAWVIGLPMLAWFTWSAFTNYETARVRKIALGVVKSNVELMGYPTNVLVEPRGRTITLSGLAPLPGARDKVIADLKAALPLSDIRDQMAIVPNGLAGAEPLFRNVKKDLVELERESNRTAVLIAIDRSIRALSGLNLPLARIRSDLGDSKYGPPIESATVVVDQAQKRLAELRIQAIATSGTASDFARLGGETRAISDILASATASLSSILPEPARLPAPADVAVGRDNAGTLVPNADRLAGEAERLAATVATLGQTTSLKTTQQSNEAEIASLRARLAALESRPLSASPLPQLVSPRDRLAAWARANAIFFANNLDFRDADRTARMLDELAQLILASDSLVRVVGYTDEIGIAARNSTLSLTRAETVQAALVQRGVPPNRLIALGRQNAIDISPTKGTQSANRRVEFEIGFIGENSP